MNSSRSIMNVTTLSMVFTRTTTWRCRAGKNLTSLKTLSSLKVLKTENPSSPCELAISMTLIKFIVVYIDRFKSKKLKLNKKLLLEKCVQIINYFL